MPTLDENGGPNNPDLDVKKSPNSLAPRGFFTILLTSTDKQVIISSFLQTFFCTIDKFIIATTILYRNILTTTHNSLSSV